MPIPYDGELMTVYNPDGSEVPVRAWGNQFVAVFETLDGHTVVQDPGSGWYHYATLSPDKQALLATADRVGDVAPDRLPLPRHVRPQRGALAAAAQAAHDEAADLSRWEVRNAERRARRARAARSSGPAAAPPQEETTGNYVGLCLLIEFPDVPSTITRQQVEDFCNQMGYAEFGNNGSVRDYFAEVSGGS